MTACDLLNNLEASGVKVWCEYGDIKMAAEAGVITPAIREAVKALKPEIVRILITPQRGSINYPMGVEARKLSRCPWDGCGGDVQGHKANNLYLCMKCGWFFELLPPQEGYPYV
jgi:TubC N-terminal docking domain